MVALKVSLMVEMKVVHLVDVMEVLMAALLVVEREFFEVGNLVVVMVVALAVSSGVTLVGRTVDKREQSME